MFEVIRETSSNVKIIFMSYQRNYNVKKRENIIFNENDHFHNHEIHNK